MDNLDWIKQLLDLIAINWPDGYWLFAANGTLYLMRSYQDNRAMTPIGGYDPEYIADAIEGIPCDGGDW